MAYKYVSVEFARKHVHKYCIPSLSRSCMEYPWLTARLFADVCNGYTQNSTDQSKFSVSCTVYGVPNVSRLQVFSVKDIIA